MKKIEKLANDHQSKKESDKDTEKSQKRRPIDKNVKSTIWKMHNGLTISGKCYVCQEPIMHHTFEAGHIIAFANGGTDDISNLKPICKSCNGAMGKMNLEEYKKKYYGSRAKTLKTTIDKKTTVTNKKASEQKSQTIDKEKPIQEKPISKRELLNGLSRAKLIKIAKKLDIDPEFGDILYEKEGYVDILSSSRKVTVEKIQEILGI
ncbi:MAG: HNH endonuclease signature motif containing protein [Candidatus Methanoperedens sp.]